MTDTDNILPPKRSDPTHKSSAVNNLNVAQSARLKKPRGGRPITSCALSLFVVFSLVVLVSDAAHAGAWTKPAGGGYVKVGSATFRSWFSYDDDGVRADSAPFSLTAQTLYVYGEVGLTDWLTFVGFAPWIFSTNRHESGLSYHTSGFGDAMGGLQVRMLQTDILVVSTRLELKLPLYEGGPSVQGRQSGVVDGFPRATPYFPALGDGQIDATTFLSIGGTIPIIDGFYSVEPGFRYRSGGITDALMVQGSAGVFVLGRRVLFMVNAVRIASLDPHTDGVLNPDDIEVVGKGFTSLGPAMSVYAWRGLALEIAADVVFMGRNAAGGVQILGGISYAW